MEQPTLSSFGLSDSEFARWHHIVEDIAPRIAVGLAGAGFVVGGITGVAVGGFNLVTPVAVLMYAAMGFAYTLLLVLIAGVAWEPLLAQFISSLASYRAFKKAQAAYEAWKNRTLVEFWRRLSGRAFEHELAWLFSRKGYSVELTPVSGDKGIDIIVRLGGRKTIVQCKATSKPVGPAVARELYGALVASGADEAILAATGGVTQGTRDFLKEKPITIMTLAEIVPWHAAESDALSNSRLRPTAAATVSG